jgi:hypothetical protein
MGQRLPSLSYREIIKALSKIAFREIVGRGKGSHVFVYRDDPPKRINDSEREKCKARNNKVDYSRSRPDG